MILEYVVEPNLRSVILFKL